MRAGSLFRVLVLACLVVEGHLASVSQANQVGSANEGASLLAALVQKGVVAEVEHMSDGEMQQRLLMFQGMATLMWALFILALRYAMMLVSKYDQKITAEDDEWHLKFGLLEAEELEYRANALEDSNLFERGKTRRLVDWLRHTAALRRQKRRLEWQKELGHDPSLDHINKLLVKAKDLYTKETNAFQQRMLKTKIEFLRRKGNVARYQAGFADGLVRRNIHRKDAPAVLAYVRTVLAKEALTADERRYYETKAKEMGWLAELGTYDKAKLEAARDANDALLASNTLSDEQRRDLRHKGMFLGYLTNGELSAEYLDADDSAEEKESVYRHKLSRFFTRTEFAGFQTGFQAASGPGFVLWFNALVMIFRASLMLNTQTRHVLIGVTVALAFVLLLGNYVILTDGAKDDALFGVRVGFLTVPTAAVLVGFVVAFASVW